jgi:molecular chaperone DnaJ
VDGNETVRVPAGTRPGTLFRIRGKGFPYIRGRGRGDHLAALFPDIPAKLTRGQRALIERLQDEGL